MRQLIGAFAMRPRVGGCELDLVQPRTIETVERPAIIRGLFICQSEVRARRLKTLEFLFRIRPAIGPSHLRRHAVIRRRAKRDDAFPRFPGLDGHAADAPRMALDIALESRGEEVDILLVAINRAYLVFSRDKVRKLRDASAVGRGGRSQ